mgnify:CR=1 FL=1
MSYLKNMKNFQISPSTTKISSITTKETVDVPTLNKLISSDLLKETFNNKYQGMIFKNELKQLMEYKKMIGSDDFIYIDMKKTNRYGRSHARLSLLQIRREIRQSITKDLYTDVDIENCHVVILQQICKKNKIKTVKLDDYINNRESYLNKLMTDYNVSRDEAKRVFLVAMYCGNFLLERDEPDYYKELVAETRSIAQLITSQNPDIKSMVETMKEDTNDSYISNLNGKVLSHYLQEFEHVIMDEVFKYCVSKKYIIDNNCSLQADGIMIPKANYKDSLLNELNKHIKKTVGFDLKFTEKEMKQHYCDIVDDHIINFIVPKIERELPKLTQSPHVVGNNKYLSNIFTEEMYKKHSTIILESCCGTGKTYSVVKYISNMASKNDVVLSIINRKSLLTAQLKEFENKNVSLNNYIDKETYNLKENGIICVNSIMKYSKVPAEDFKNFIVYIDEIDSLIETLTHSEILTKDIKLVYSTLSKIVKNCKKLIVSDHTITKNVFNFIENRLHGVYFHVKNKFQKFEGVEAFQIKDEMRFKTAIMDKMKMDEPFFAGFDSARNASCYFYNMKNNTKLECILVTDETKVVIPKNMSEWENKCIFYSPKIETGVDFNIDTKQSVFFHMKGESILPTSSFQMIARTRNMKDLTYFCVDKKTKDYKYKDLDDVKKVMKNEQNITNMYMNCSYLDVMDNLKFSENSFFNLYCFNEYVKDIYEQNKTEHLKDILYKNGFKCSEIIDEIPSQLSKEVKTEMKEVVDECTEEIFNKWIEGEIMHENFDIRKNILKLSEKEDIIKYKEYVYDRTTFENHGKTVLLMKDKEFIKEKSHDMMSNSYKEFGIHNIFSKIELLSIYEKETKIKRFNYDDATPTVKDSTWNMILKLFRKKTKKPENKADIIKEYVGLVNNISKLYEGKRIQENKERKTDYILDTDILKASYKLDKFNDNLRADYCYDTLTHIKFKKPKKEEIIEDNEEPEVYDLDM